MKSYLLTALFLLLLPYPADSQNLDYYLPDGVTYDENIPTPAEIIGHEVGEWHVTHDKLVYYMHALAEASDRVTIEENARTYEGRPLLMLTITSPENHASIDRIKENHHLLLEPERSETLDVSSMPVIINMGFSVHGNEPSGANASMLSAYYFAAARGNEIEEQLQNAVILLDPSLNPDGLNRFATWANMHKSQTSVTDPSAREFREVWPGGRTNHYWFDLNRDWMPAQHPESRGRLAKFHEWKPNVLTDHHEMGTSSTFFFQPGIPSRTHPLTPGRNQDLTAAIGEFHAEALDEIQSLYFTKEAYDDFYYGKGSTYPDVFGAVGILFEQASSRGHAQESQNGVVTFPFTIKNQFTTSLSTLRASVALREDLHDHMRAFYRDVNQEAARASVKAIVVGDAKDRGKNFHLADMLSHHDIEFYKLARDLQANGSDFKEGMAYIIPTEQNQYRFIESLFERRTTFTDSLFYDISTWTIPFAFNMPFAEITQNGFSRNLLGERIQAPEKPQGQIVGGRSQYAYAFEWDEYYSPRALYRLQDMGVKAAVASRPFRASTTAGVTDFDYGTIIVPLGIQDDASESDIFRKLQEAAAEDGLTVYSLRTGLSVEGIDLGSRSMNMLEKPVVAVLAGRGVSNLEVGEIWHQMDQRYQIPVTILEKDRVSSADLSRYNNIILASGSYTDLSGGATTDLKQWVSNGGTLIVQRGAITWARGENLVKTERIEIQESASNGNQEPQPYIDLQDARGAQVIGGAIFSSRLDLTHPLGYGFKNSEMHSFRNSTQFLKRTANPYATPLYLTDNPLASGYVSDENLEKAGGSASVVVTRYGQGRVIAFVDNPNFRAFWFGTNKLFANALFFGNTISAAAAD
ncbi:MAG: M14 family metallopeptidase [Balneolaceae bacterium]